MENEEKTQSLVLEARDEREKGFSDFPVCGIYLFWYMECGVNVWVHHKSKQNKKIRGGFYWVGFKGMNGEIFQSWQKARERHKGSNSLPLSLSLCAPSSQSKFSLA